MDGNGTPPTRAIILPLLSIGDSRITDGTPSERQHLVHTLGWQLQYLIRQIEWGDQNRDPSGWCPACARSREAYGGRHAYGCAVRQMLDILDPHPKEESAGA